ncbi:hypothetical protein [Mucilaginibacter sp. HD30]
MSTTAVFQVFQSRSYQLFFAGQLISRIGMWMQRTAVIWIVYSLTHSVFMVGLATFALRSVFPPGIGLEQAITLIRVGALRFTGKSKKQLLWEVHLLLGTKVKPKNDVELFQVESKNYNLPVLVNTKLEDANHELELLGFPLSMTVFELLESDYRGELCTDDLINHIGR